MRKYHFPQSKGHFHIPIKIYRPNTHPQYPDGGELTPWLEQLPVTHSPSP